MSSDGTVGATVARKFRRGSTTTDSKLKAGLRRERSSGSGEAASRVGLRGDDELLRLHSPLEGEPYEVDPWRRRCLSGRDARYRVGRAQVGLGCRIVGQHQPRRMREEGRIADDPEPPMIVGLGGEAVGLPGERHSAPDPNAGMPVSKKVP